MDDNFVDRKENQPAEADVLNAFDAINAAPQEPVQEEVAEKPTTEQVASEEREGAENNTAADAADVKIENPVNFDAVRMQQEIRRQVDAFYEEQKPAANGCTYAYGRMSSPPQQPPVQSQQPQTQQTYARPQQPQQTYNRPQQPQQPAYAQRPPVQPPYASAQNAQSAPPVNKKNKKEKKQRNRMSFGQVFLCVVLCLIVGSVSGYVSSKTTVRNMLEEFSQQQADSSTTGSYNINIFEQPTQAPTQAPETTQPAEQATVPVVSDQTSASEIYKSNVNAVVNITAEGTRTVNYGFFFGSQSKEFTSSGSGFFLTTDGYILTNYHVVENTHTIVVTDYEGDEHPAELIGYEESNDIAVLKVNGTFQAVELGDSTKLEVGDTLLIIGNALGELQYTLTQGVVSYLERAVTTDTGAVINMFQTDAAINSGNSGGPVFNAKGEVVGIASAKYASSSIEGLGFCIPIDDVKLMISDIVNVGYVTGKPSLGASLYTNTSRANGLPYGCYVVAVGAGSAAALAGLAEGDVITAINGTSVRDVDDFGSVLSKSKAGDTVTLTVYHASTSMTSDVTVVLDEYKPADPRTEYTNVYDF